MPAGGFRTFVAGETLDENDINDYLMQGVLVFAGSAARGSAITSPVAGQFSWLTGTSKLEYYTGSYWAEYVGGLNWATVGTATGTYTTGTQVVGDVTWQWYRFTGAGTVTFSDAGYADLLVVGGGGGGEFDGEFGSNGGGGGGDIMFGAQEVAATSYAVTVGAGAATGQYSQGGTSSFGTIVLAGGGRGPRMSGDQASIDEAAFGGGGMGGALAAINAARNYDGGGQGGTVWGNTVDDGITLNYHGTAVEYGPGGRTTAPVANSGSGGQRGANAGASGVVIVRVQI